MSILHQQGKVSAAMDRSPSSAIAARNVRRAMNRLRISHVRLMRESEDRVERAVHSLDPYERMVAGRVLETPLLQRTWAAEHFSILQSIATERRASNQVAALKSSSFKLIHRKALFEYLRLRGFAAGDKRRAMALFHPSRSLTDAVIIEHREYLRSACSYLCTSYLGGVVIGDGTFDDPFARYEELYSDYFRTFCDVALTAEQDGEVGNLRALLPYLKHQVAQRRLAILSLPYSKPISVRQNYLGASQPATRSTVDAPAVR